MRLLLVEDDDRVADALSRLLTHSGFHVDRTSTVAGAKQLLKPETDAILLDLGLPDADGLEFCRWVRERSDITLIVVTARADIDSRVRGLDLGADDYLVKPYDVRELLARLRAIGRRKDATAATNSLPAPSPTITIRAGRVELTRSAREVRVDGRLLTLSRLEFDLLEMLCRAPGVVFRRDQLLRELWGSSWQTSAHSLEVHIAALRSKIAIPDTIETVRGVGYRLSGE